MKLLFERSQLATKMAIELSVEMAMPDDHKHVKTDDLGNTMGFASSRRSARR
jgi:hypothetical protein